MNADKNVKKKYIEAAYQIMSDSGVEAISARKLATILNCAPSSIYKHFDGLDEIILYASLRYLKEYYVEVNQVASQSENALEMYLNTERCFAEHSFREPIIFNNNMFSIQSNKVGHMMQDFFAMYHDEMPPIDIYTSSILSRGTFSECNKKLLINCIEEGLLNIPPDKLEIVNDTIVNLYRGFLKDMLDNMCKCNPSQQAERYLTCFRNILQFYRVHPTDHL